MYRLQQAATNRTCIGRFVGIELVNDKNPPCLGVGFNRVGNMVSARHTPQRVAPIEGALPLPFGNVPIRNQAMATP